jgi:hypothetical protein
MKILILIFNLILSNGSIDTSCCHANIILRNKQVLIPIFKDLKHKDTVNFLIDDTLKEEYFSGVLLQIKGKYAYIKGQYMGYGYIYEGWIMKKYIATNLITLDSIPLYKDPQLKAIKTYIIDSKWYPVEILKCRDGCLYIKYYVSRQKKKGWLSPKYQCADPYTTCC